MIIIKLADQIYTLVYPSISEDCDGNLMLCEDGLNNDDRKRIIYACPCCAGWLFRSDELKWADKDGYWINPAQSLQHPLYNSDTEVITCPDCKWEARLEFFSNFG